MFHHPDTVYQMDVSRRRAAGAAAHEQMDPHESEAGGRVRFRLRWTRIAEAVANSS